MRRCEKRIQLSQKKNVPLAKIVTKHPTQPDFSAGILWGKKESILKV